MGPALGKIRITFKTPDAVHFAVKEHVNDMIMELEMDCETGDCALDDEDLEFLESNRPETIKQALEKWIKYGELVTIDFDLDKGTAEVIEQ